MIQYFSYKDKLKPIKDFSKGCWVNVIAPLSLDEVRTLHETVGIPKDFWADTMDIDERSRFDIDGKVSMIIVRTPYENQPSPDIEENEASYITVPTAIILLGKTVVTVDYFSNLSSEKSILNSIKHKKFRSSAELILNLFEENTKSFMGYLKEINHRTSLFENQLFNSNKNEQLMNLLKMQKSLVYFVTSLRTNENLFLKLGRVDILKLNQEEKDYLMDIVVDTSQALEMSNIYTNILSSTLDSFATIIANNQNEVLRKLSIITLVVTIPTLVASIYGMNVPLPSQESPITFYITISLSFVASLFIGWLMLKRRVL